MNLFLKSVAKKTLIAFMLLSFSMYASSFQLGVAAVEDIISVDIVNSIDHAKPVLNVDQKTDQHCDSTSSQHCNSCTHCVVIALTQLVKPYEPLIVGHSDTAPVIEKRIEVPFKPPRY